MRLIHHSSSGSDLGTVSLVALAGCAPLAGGSGAAGSPRTARGTLREGLAISLTLAWLSARYS